MFSLRAYQISVDGSRSQISGRVDLHICKRK
jgi:hypothetical protein